MLWPAHLKRSRKLGLFGNVWRGPVKKSSQGSLPGSPSMCWQGKSRRWRKASTEEIQGDARGSNAGFGRSIDQQSSPDRLPAGACSTGRNGLQKAAVLINVPAWVPAGEYQPAGVHRPSETSDRSVRSEAGLGSARPELGCTEPCAFTVRRAFRDRGAVLYRSDARRPP